MRFGSNVLVAALASIVLFACKGPQSDVKAPETDPWGDYKGTYAAGVPQEVAPAEAKPKAVADAQPSKAAPAKPSKRGAARRKKGAVAVALAMNEPTTTTTTAADSSADSDDARSMYGIKGSPGDEEAAAPATKKATKKTAKKRGGKKKGAGKKRHAKK